MSIASIMYRLARLFADVESLTSIRKATKRQRNKAIGRALFRRLWRL